MTKADRRRGFLLAVALACSLIVPRVAVADPSLGIKVAPTTNDGPPVEINECAVLYRGGWLVGQAAGVKIEFTNDTDKKADVINFGVSDGGSHGGNIRDVGSFAPGIEVRHKYRAGDGMMMFSPLFSHPHISCSVVSVHFEDGTVWRAGQSISAPQTSVDSTAASLTAAPSQLAFDSVGSRSAQLLTLTAVKATTFTQTNNCSAIANVVEVSHDDAQVVYNVVPTADGLCGIIVRDATGAQAMVIVKVQASTSKQGQHGRPGFRRR